LVGIGVGYLVSYFPPVVLLLFILWPFVWICALKAAGFSSDHWEALRLARGLVAQAEEKGDPEVAAIFERIGFKSWDRWDRLEDLLLFWPLLATLIAYVTYFPFVAWHLGESAFAVFMRAPFWHLVVLPLSLLIMVMTMGLAYGAGERQFESRNTVAFEDLKP